MLCARCGTREISQREQRAGGCHCKGCKITLRITGIKKGPMSEELKRKLSECNRGRKRPPMSEEARKKVSEGNKRSWAEGRRRRKFTKEHKDKIRASLRKAAAEGRMRPSDEALEKNRQAHLGKKITPQTQEKINAARKKAKETGFTKDGRPYVVTWGRKKGYKVAPERLKNYRLGALKRIEARIGAGGQVNPNWNTTAAKWFEELNVRYGLHGRHAANGGEHRIAELGYFLDYYVPELNLVVEWDESYHKKESEKDIVRQSEIIKHLGCHFFRVSDYSGSLTEHKARVEHFIARLKHSASFTHLA